MKKTIIRGIALLAALAMLTAFTGCLRFSNSLDLSTPLTNEGSVSTQQPTGESEPAATLPGSTDPTETPSDTESTDPSASESATGTPDESTAAPDESTTGTPADSTAAPDEGSTETPAESTTGVQSLQDYVRSLGTTDYDVLRSNNCSVTGMMESPEEVTPMELSIAPDKLYIVSEMDGIQIGMYVEGKKTYIYLPKHQSYLKLSTTVAKLIGMDPAEFSAMADDLGFDALPPLSEAESMQDAVIDGVPCKQFTVRANSEITRVYMNGPKLVSIDYLDENGSVGSTMRFTSVSAGFPQMPPAGFSEIGYIDFAKIIMAEME